MNQRVSIRPIISYIGSLLSSINKYKANILKAYIKDENNKANNFTMFFNYIRNVSTEDDEIMASLCAWNFLAHKHSYN